MTGRLSQQQRRTLEELRLARGLTREQLAVVAGLSAKTVYRLEVGGSVPRESTIRVLARALDCDPVEIGVTRRCELEDPREAGP
jgi:transcriptional regulator with XRE-family HTH domain